MTRAVETNFVVVAKKTNSQQKQEVTLLGVNPHFEHSEDCYEVYSGTISEIEYAIAASGGGEVAELAEELIREYRVIQDFMARHGGATRRYIRMSYV